MANIREKKKDGKIIAFSFTVCLERDASGKQVRRYATWTPPEGLALTKARKAAERAADAWEIEVKAEYQKEKEAKAQGHAYMLPPDKRHDDFVAFVQNTWLPLQVRDGSNKPNTVAFYQNIAKIITEYFKGRVLQEIGPLDIQKYMVYLRTRYKSKLDKPLSPKTLRHHYGTLNLIFGYAERQELIAKNPMQKIEAPKREKKPVDSLTQEQAAWQKILCKRKSTKSRMALWKQGGIWRTLPWCSQSRKCAAGVNAAAYSREFYRRGNTSGINRRPAEETSAPVG